MKKENLKTILITIMVVVSMVAIGSACHTRGYQAAECKYKAKIDSIHNANRAAVESFEKVLQEVYLEADTNMRLGR